MWSYIKNFKRNNAFTKEVTNSVIKIMRFNNKTSKIRSFVSVNNFHCRTITITFYPKSQDLAQKHIWSNIEHILTRFKTLDQRDLTFKLKMVQSNFLFNLIKISLQRLINVLFQNLLLITFIENSYCSLYFGFFNKSRKIFNISDRLINHWG